MVTCPNQGRFFSGEGSGVQTAGWSTRIGTWLLAVFVALSLGFGAPSAHARRALPEASAPAARTDTIALSALPRAGREVYQRIGDGGPFAYDKDGSVFGNRERQLPAQRRGFYREYTVRTPGERDRGARRIVCGGKDARQPETCFYTQDHYQSFQLIDPSH
jgi:ribonuclease T1